MTRPDAIITAARLLKLAGFTPEPTAVAVLAVTLLPSDLPEAQLLGELLPHVTAATVDVRRVFFEPTPLAVALLAAGPIADAIGKPIAAPKPRAKASKV